MVFVVIMTVAFVYGLWLKDVIVISLVLLATTTFFIIIYQYEHKITTINQTGRKLDVYTIELKKKEVEEGLPSPLVEEL